MTGAFEEPLPDARVLGIDKLVHMARVTSTMDEAHALAERGAPSGTLVLADEQTAGRGRGGNVWESQSRSGIWCTLIERPTDTAAIDVLSIRLGLAIARAVEDFAPGRISLKWPNDVYVGAGKLAGILVEARWREGVVDWVAIGVGLNLTVPTSNAGAVALRAGTTRNDTLCRMIPAIRDAARMRGMLSEAEQLEWLQRDLARDRAVSSPVPGIVRGIERNGALRVEDVAGEIHHVRTGSLIFT